MTCMSCTTDRTPSLCLSNEMLPSTCCKYFTFFHSSISHSPLQPTAQLNNSYHLSLRFYNLNKWWVLDIPCCGLIYLLPLKLRLTIIINDNFFLLAKVSACNWVSFAKKDTNVIYGGILKQNDYCSVTMRAQPPLIFLSGEQKGGSAWITSNLWGSHSPNFWTSQSCSLSSNWFFWV